MSPPPPGSRSPTQLFIPPLVASLTNPEAGSRVISGKARHSLEPCCPLLENREILQPLPPPRASWSTP